MQKEKKLGFLNFEGDVFKIIRQKNQDTYDIVDYKGSIIIPNISGRRIVQIYDGSEKITASDGRSYLMTEQHSNAKPSREELLTFLGLNELDSYHYHEAVDRLSIVIDIIEAHLIKHPVVESNGQLNKLISKANKKLLEAYQLAYEIND